MNGKRVGALLPVAIILGAAFWWITSRISPATITPEAPVLTVSAPAARPSTKPPARSAIDGGTSAVTVADQRQTQAALIFDDVLPLVKDAPSEIRAVLERLKREQREEAWANASETMMRATYGKLKGIGEAERQIDVICRATVCQVSGSLDDRPRGQGGDVMRAVQAPQLIEDMAARGYRHKGSAFGPGGRTRDMFVTYFERAKPEVIKL